MTRLILTLTFFSLFIAGASAQEEKTANVHIGLIYPISSNGVNAKEITNVVSINAIAGVSAGEKAFCASGLSNIVLGDAAGLTATGFGNYIQGSATGLQAAGFMNYIKEDVTGMQAAGFMNITGSARGAQAAGFMNIAQGSVQGAQFAGFFNMAGDVNAQFAGFINIAKNVKGVQFAGFINIAEHSDCPIGLVNIIKDGEKNIGLSVDENLTTMVSFRSGGRILYGILGIGYNAKSSDVLWALEGGFGAHLPISRSFRVNGEAIMSSLTNFEEDVYLKANFRLLPSVMLGSKWELFGGPTFNFISYDVYSTGLEDNYLWSTTEWDKFYGFSFGAIGGITYHL